MEVTQEEMKEMKQTTHTRTKTKITREFNGAEVAEALMGKGASIEFSKNVIVSVQVPGGGNWANTTLVIGEDAPLVLEFTIETEEVDDFDSKNDGEDEL